MNKKVLNLFLFFSIFVSLLSLFSFIDVSHIKAKEDTVYGEVAIDEIHHFHLTYGISPSTSFAPGSIGQMGRDTRSAFAFNLPEEIETIVSKFQQVTVRYRVCEVPIILDFTRGFSFCYEQSDYIIEELKIENRIETYYNNHFFDWMFGGKKSATPIDQVGLMSDLVDYSDKDNLNPLASVNSEVKDYKYYAVMSQSKTYSSAIIEIRYVDLDGVPHIDECIIDPETGACIIQEEKPSPSDIINSILEVLNWIGNNKEYIIFLAGLLLIFVFAPGLIMFVVFASKITIKLIRIIMKIMFFPLTLHIKRSKKKKEIARQKELVKKEVENIKKEKEAKNGNS